MKLLLTDSGLSNDTIRKTLVELMGKPISEASLAYIPTSMYANPNGIAYVWELLPAVQREGWKSASIVELSVLPTLPLDFWLPTVQAADVIYVGGGNTNYLSYWMQASGFADHLPALLEHTVYMGASAGSMVVTDHLQIDRKMLAETGIYYDDVYKKGAPLNAGSDKTLKWVNFVMRPHLGVKGFEQITLEAMEKDAATLDVPMYVTDDQTAIVVEDGVIRVVSEGKWKVFNNGGATPS